MKKHLRFLCALLALLGAGGAAGAQTETFSMRPLACGLSQPWEIKFGPDGYLWATEAHSYQLNRVDPVSGNVEMLLDLSAKKDFPNFGAAATFPQGGLQGFAFHPAFSTNPYVYIAYVHHFDSCAAGTGGCFFRTRIARYTYDTLTKAFSDERIVTDTIPGSSDHNGGRLVVSPPNLTGPGYLYYSVGDMGAGHMGNGSRQHRGQRTDVWEGKILRFNLVPDGDAGPNGWIPDNGPFSTAASQNAVWSFGHRNPQGLVFSPNGTLYESEHGPYSDDEINIIQSGHNYGFPLIVGYTDGNYDGSKAGAGSGLPLIVSESANRTILELNHPYSEPIYSLFPATQGEVTTMFTNDVNQTPPYANYYLQYPTSAPSGIDFYGADGIPGWKNSLLVTNLKLANVYRLKLSNDGLSVVGDTLPLFSGLGRFRDLAISADGKKIYVAADSSGVVKGLPGQAVTPPNRGCILEFSYVPTSVNETAAGAGIRIYPNPAKGRFTLQLPDGVQAATVSISNVFGQESLRTAVASGQSEISTAGLAPGLYNVRVVSGAQSWVEKLQLR